MTFPVWELVEGTGLWQDHKNQVTGEHSVKNHTLHKVWESCIDHYFVEEGNSRTVICRQCGMGKRYTLGVQKLVKGKLV